MVAVGVRLKASGRELAVVPLRRDDWHGEWNHAVLPAAASPHPDGIGKLALSIGPAVVRVVGGGADRGRPSPTN
jgi:hypothetical protein